MMLTYVKNFTVTGGELHIWDSEFNLKDLEFNSVQKVYGTFFSFFDFEN